MVKKIDKIIQSKTTPKSNNVLWDDGESLKINRNGRWNSVLSPISDEELDEILNGSSYYYYNDEGIGTWDISVGEESEDEISS